MIKCSTHHEPVEKKIGIISMLIFFVVFGGLILPGCVQPSGGDSPSGEDSIAVDPKEVTVAAGTTCQFTAEVKDSADVSQELVWSLAGDHVEGTGITEDGLLTVALEETASTLTITAAARADPAKTGKAAVTVVPSDAPPFVSEIVISPRAPSIAKGGTLQFTAEVKGSADISQELVWSIAGDHVEGTGITDGGLLTIAAEETALTLTVTAVSAAVESSQSGQAFVTVGDGGAGNPALAIDQPGPVSIGGNGLDSFVELTVLGEDMESITWVVDGTPVDGTETGYTLSEDGASLTVTAGALGPGGHSVTVWAFKDNVPWSLETPVSITVVEPN
jgi:hypothetical protein